MNEELEKKLKEATDGAMAQLFVAAGKVKILPEGPVSNLLAEEIIASLNKFELKLSLIYKKAARQEDTSAETENEHKNP